MIIDQVEAGRVDIVHSSSTAEDIDAELIAHVCSESFDEFGKSLVMGIGDTFQSVQRSFNVHAKIYQASFNSVLVFPTNAGLKKWTCGTIGFLETSETSELIQKAFSSFADKTLDSYKNTMREYGPKDVWNGSTLRNLMENPLFCTHEVCFPHGSSFYFAGCV